MQEKKQYIVAYTLARFPAPLQKGKIQVEAWDDVQAMKEAKQQLYAQVGRKNAYICIIGVVEC